MTESWSERERGREGERERERERKKERERERETIIDKQQVTQGRGWREGGGGG